MERMILGGLDLTLGKTYRLTGAPLACRVVTAISLPFRWPTFSPCPQRPYDWEVDRV